MRRFGLFLLCLSLTGCVAVWGSSYHMEGGDSSGGVIRFDHVLISGWQVMRHANDFCEKYNRVAVKNGERYGVVLPGGSIDQLTFSCVSPKPDVENSNEQYIKHMLQGIPPSLGGNAHDSQVVDLNDRDKTHSRLETFTFHSSRPRPDDVAVIIGNADYSGSSDIPPVPSARNDAEAMRIYARQALGIRPDNIIYVGDATKGKLDRIFGNNVDYKGELFNYISPGKSHVFVFYAGHGAPGLNGGAPYIVPSNADPSALKLTGYPLSLLYHNLARLPASQITVVLDACFSGESPTGPLTDISHLSGPSAPD